MITQHTPHLPHRKAPARHDPVAFILAALALVAVAVGLGVVVSRPAPLPVAQRPRATTSYVPGIVDPAGQDITNMPRGYTDYLLNRQALTIRPQTTSYVPGIVAPAGQDITNMPRGYTDYVLPEP